MILRRDGYRCTDCGKLRPAEELEVDHVIEVADGGSDDPGNLATRCKPCHQKKTNRSRAARSHARKLVASGRSVSDGTHASVAWLKYPIASGMLLWAGGEVTDQPVTRELIGLCIITLVIVAWRERHHHRVSIQERMKVKACAVTKANPSKRIVRVKRWRGSLPVKFSISYDTLMNDQDDAAREKLESTLEHLLGVDLVAEWRPRSSLVVFSARSASDLERVEAQVEREVASPYAALDEAISNLIGNEPRIQHKSDERFVVRYSPRYRDDSDEVRQALQDVVRSRTQDRWKANWNTKENWVEFVRRPEMPASIPHPVPEKLDPWKLPTGVDEHGAVVEWDLRVAPHMLCVGSTGGGKTVFISGLIVEAALRGFDIYIIDGKGTSLAGFRRWPGVVDFGFGEPQEMSECMLKVEGMMRDRYAKVRDEGAEPEEFKPVLVILDEAAEFTTNVTSWWKSGGKQASGSTLTQPPAIDSWKAIARLGREARVHLVVGIQQAAAKFFDGTEARDNFGARIGCGPLKATGAQMAFDRTDIGRDIPKECKGRSTAMFGDEPQEIQVFFTPTPKANGDIRPQHRELLESLLPDTDTVDLTDRVGEKKIKGSIRADQVEVGMVVDLGDGMVEVLEIEEIGDDNLDFTVSGPDGVEVIGVGATDWVSTLH